jgi:uncharacterized protein YlzI (FlbEa/FlbD family)
MEIYSVPENIDEVCNKIYDYYLDYEKKSIFKFDSLFVLLNWSSY